MSDTRDHVVNIRDRYPDIDFDHFTDLDEFAIDVLKENGIDWFSFKYEEESCMSRKPQVDYDRLRVGDLLWYLNIEEPVPHWHEVVVTHLHGGIVFFRRTSGEDKDEKWLPTGSLGYYLGLYPKKVIIPKGTKCTCQCPLTVFENEH